MYRLLILIGLIGLAAGKCSSERDGRATSRSKNTWFVEDDYDSSLSVDSYRFQRRSSSVELTVSEITRKLIDAENQMAQFCSRHTDRALREVYGVEHFLLRVRLNEFKEHDIQVRVRRRLVTVHARDCSDEYAALRILPDIVDARQATWKFESGTLTVMFPYNRTPDMQLLSKCGREPRVGVIDVPQAVETTNGPEDELNLGDDRIKRALRRLLNEIASEDDNRNHENSMEQDNDDNNNREQNYNYNRRERKHQNRDLVNDQEEDLIDED